MNKLQKSHLVFGNSIIYMINTRVIVLIHKMVKMGKNTKSHQEEAVVKELIAGFRQRMSPCKRR